VDYHKSHANKSTFVRDVFDALAGAGFMLLDGVDGLEDAVQQRCFKVAHDFFLLGTAVIQRYSLCDNPRFRGWGSPGGTALGGAAMGSRSVCAAEK
jgi:isopenicillin N synthase-like dioxygenase